MGGIIGNGGGQLIIQRGEGNGVAGKTKKKRFSE